MFDIQRFVMIPTIMLTVGTIAVAQSPDRDATTRPTRSTTHVNWQELQNIHIEEFPDPPQRTSKHQLSFELLRTPTPAYFSPIPNAPSPALPPIKLVERPSAELAYRFFVFRTHRLGHPTPLVQLSSQATELPRGPIAATPLITRSVSTTVDTSQDNASSGTQINFELLRQRIDSHNLSVGAVEDQLLATESWSLPQLESVFSQIEQLIQRRDTWSIYFQLLDEKQSKKIGSIASVHNLLRLLQRRVFELEVTANDAAIAKRLVKINAKVANWLQTL